MSALNALATRDWAIEPDMLKQMAVIAMRLNDGPEQLEAVAKKFSPRMEKAMTAQVRDGVSIIPVAGPIFPKGNLFTAVCGATSLDILMADLTAAIEDPRVTSIILDIDSPGGAVNGVAEASDMIREYAKIKPITAYTSGYCCSAAYWLACACTEIVVHRGAQVGSIGIVSSIPVQEEADANGYKTIEIVSSNAAQKRPDPRTEPGKASIVARLDALEKEFIGTVASYRGKTAQHVKENFGAGGVLIAEEAVRAGMADRIGNFEGLIEELKSKHNPPTKGNTMTTKADDKPVVTAESLAATNPDVLAAIRADAAKAERDRILGIEQAALPGHEDLVAKAKADGKTTGADLALQIITAEKARGPAALDATRAALAAMPKVDPSASNEPAKKPAADDASKPVEERCKAKWDADAALREEYRGNFASYLAFTKADENGQIKLAEKK